MKRRTLLSAIVANSVAAAGVALLGTRTASAQAFPNKPIRIIVPFTPGSATDTMARPIAERLTAALGQQVLIENRPGAGGTIGANALAKADRKSVV